MTDDQLFDLLQELEVSRVFKPAGGRISLVLGHDRSLETLTATELKSRSVDAIRGLEEERQEVIENRFAAPIEGAFPVAGANTVPVRILRRNDQLSEEDRRHKERLLERIDAQISYHRLVIAGMNHLQVNYKELALRLIVCEASTTEQTGSPSPEERLPWTKGIKAAALQCLRESRLTANSGKTELDVCREFLERYAIEEDEDYAPQRLFLNIQQIKMLDQPD
jgi:hypothetical protein